jgi:hypothetical protein
VVVTMKFSREQVAETLRRTGFPDAAGEAERGLSDPAEGEQIEEFLAPYGITLDELVDRMGGTV